MKRFVGFLLLLSVFLLQPYTAAAKELRVQIVFFPSDGKGGPTPSLNYDVIDGDMIKVSPQGDKLILSSDVQDFLFSKLQIRPIGYEASYESTDVVIGIAVGDNKTLQVPVLLTKSSTSAETAIQLIRDSVVIPSSLRELFLLHQRSRIILEARLAEIDNTLRPTHGFDIRIAFIYLQTFQRLFNRASLQPDEFIDKAADFLLNARSTNPGLFADSLGAQGAKDIDPLIQTLRALPMVTLQKLYEEVLGDQSQQQCDRFRKLEVELERYGGQTEEIDLKAWERLVQSVGAAVTACVGRELAAAPSSVNIDAARQQVEKNRAIIESLVKITPAELKARNEELVKSLSGVSNGD